MAIADTVTTADQASFVYRTVPQRIVFGAGTRTRIREEVRLAGIARAMIVSTPGHAARADELAALLGDCCQTRFSWARMHTPVPVTEEAVAHAVQHRVDGIVAVGGGSAIGLAKAIALRTDIIQLVLPTTYAGSEMTDIVGQTAGGVKQTVRDPKVLPEVVVYDVDLTSTLPAILSVTSGMNAMAHAIEGLYAENTNPLVAVIAEEGVRALASALPRVSKALDDMRARAEALYGAWLCGTVLGATSMALHHKLCHVLGGTFDLPHAQTHAVLLPHTIAYNAPAAPAAIARAARALGVDACDVPSRLFDLARDAGAPVSLRALGLPGDALERAADLALSNPYWNPRPLERDGVRGLLNDAWRGSRPERMTVS
jgi:alcohol dehydrogenase class IV